MTRSAIVVAGGYSRRFGDREKALATLEGIPMLVRVARAVSPAVDELVVNCRADQRPDFERALASVNLDAGVRFAIDQRTDEGPVTGLRRALETATGESAVVVPCDLPLLETRFVDRLFDSHRRADTAAVVPRVDGYLQPLCAVYTVSAALEACTTTLEADRYRLFDVLDELDIAVLEEQRLEEWTEPARLEAIDTPASLQRLRERKVETAVPRVTTGLER
ncbi:molybdenum cofactor guanylyltransferase [Halobacteria archaeon AArc-m2/3/4]|uniref:Probable molybdenum cofactor guanylyltransferase n=1 Tax=Natronoglomus mannanivorans TaxID=2979990 RepID=A0AAP2Z2H6_9EURY|nr:molybdenum cofactor guanylyltransferase [Halobacteria archaeon AArc-xg1-1]MCU4972174.1 molybdenum cofactor guanylyltransferase [Halobacteria archaeon AArc-m2/3/4]